jgi:ubiquinone/menaquinone biosynthesis C-methylase UbiE
MMRREPEPELMDDDSEAGACARADFSGVNEAFVDRLLELTVPLAGKAVEAVDLGTGPGDIPIRVSRKRPSWRIVAVDASAPMLSHARHAAIEAGLGDRIRWELADAKDTHLPDGDFDVIFSNSILHHVNETGVFWAEVKRLARPGAICLLRDLARPPSKQAALDIVQRYASGESNLLQEEFYRSLLSAYTVEEVRKQLGRASLAGLEVAMVTDRHLDVFGRFGR